MLASCIGQNQILQLLHHPLIFLYTKQSTLPLLLANGLQCDSFLSDSNLTTSASSTHRLRSDRKKIYSLRLCPRQADIKLYQNCGPPRQYRPTRSFFRSSSCVLDKRLHLAPVPHGVNQLLSRAHREQVDAGRLHPPQHVGEAQLIPGREPHHLIEPEAHEQVGRRGVIPHDH
jgi:hypothetical protein